MQEPASTPSTTVATSRDSLLSLGAGGLMGLLVMQMAAQRPGSGLSLAMAVLFVVSGTTSLVMALLSRPHRLRPSQRGGEVKGWLLATGLGLLAAVQLQSLWG